MGATFDQKCYNVRSSALRYMFIEIDKNLALSENNGNYNAPMTLSHTSITDIKWWLANITDMKATIHVPEYGKIIFSDASKEGWGAHSDGVQANGRWTDLEQKQNINVLELLAAKFALFSFCKSSIPSHIRLMLDNTTAVSYINHQGGTISVACNKVSRDMWEWAEQNHTWISAAHVPGTINTIADSESRQFDDDTEWSLTDTIFSIIVNKFGMPDIDMFATRMNAKTQKYVSWRPDPGCIAVDAFYTPWDYSLIYCFPPFSVIWRTIAKIRREEAEAIVIVPLWHTQSWFPYGMQMLVDYPIVFPANLVNLYLPNKPQLAHPMKKLYLGALRLSGKLYKSTTFLNKLRASYNHHGGPAHRADMKMYLPNGKYIVVNKTQIPFILV